MGGTWPQLTRFGECFRLKVETPDSILHTVEFETKLYFYSFLSSEISLSQNIIQFNSSGKNVAHLDKSAIFGSHLFGVEVDDDRLVIDIIVAFVIYRQDSCFPIKIVFLFERTGLTARMSLFEAFLFFGMNMDRLNHLRRVHQVDFSRDCS